MKPVFLMNSGLEWHHRVVTDEGGTLQLTLCSATSHFKTFMSETCSWMCSEQGHCCRLMVPIDPQSGSKPN